VQKHRVADRLSGLLVSLPIYCVKYSLVKAYKPSLGALYAMIVRNKREGNPDFGEFRAKYYPKGLVLVSGDVLIIHFRADAAGTPLSAVAQDR
jgi:hypothetical protein